MRGVSIRPATEADFEAVYGFINLLEETVFDRDAQRRIFLDNLSQSRHIFLIAEIGGGPVGFLSCHVQLLLHHGGPVGEIQELFVSEAFRGRNVGKALTDALKAIAFSRGILQIEVTSGRRREAAHRFYEREGFPWTHKKFVWEPRRKG